MNLLKAIKINFIFCTEHSQNKINYMFKVSTLYDNNHFRTKRSLNQYYKKLINKQSFYFIVCDCEVVYYLHLEV